jgi:hypothetical protein
MQDVPVADVISLHGVWSWVPQSVRDGIVRLLNARLRPGGVLHISYNTLPGWQSGLGFQRLLHETGRRMAARSDRQALAGLEMVRALAAAGAKQLNFPLVRGMVEKLDKVAPEYLAHEYMNASWSPCFHADVAAALSAAKLNWVASAQLMENFSELILSEEQRAVLNRTDEPAMRELIKDLCLDRPLRHDVFVRGARRLDTASRDAALGEVMLALTCSPDSFSYEAEMPAGRAALPTDMYRPIVEELAHGPRKVRDLIELSSSSTRRNPAELIAMLIGTEQAIPVSGVPLPANTDRARRFNAAALDRAMQSMPLSAGMALATTGLGVPYPCRMLEACIQQQVQAGETSAHAMAAALAQGKPPEERERLASFIDQILEESKSVWHCLGL